MTTRIICVLIWLVAFMWAVDIGMRMLSAPNTAENLAGLAVIVGAAIVSVKTNCLTKLIKLWKKLSKSESER